MTCRVVSVDEEAYSLASKRLQELKLVAFPTETVYGLGANALSTEAVLKIFEAKKRPLTDPLIVHVPDFDSALPLVTLETDGVKEVFKKLTSTFWPGPLTLILPASDKIPPEITASTGFVGIRVPKGKTALQLLKTCKLPIAAPSANRFGHVSPTTAEHVYSDLKDSDLLILESDKDITVGIESTVAKLESISDSKVKLKIFRKGGISEKKLRDCLKSFQQDNSNLTIEIEVIHKQVKNKAEPSPGQEVTHYAPEIETYLVNSPLKLENSVLTLRNTTTEKTKTFDLSETVFIDFFKAHENYKDKVLKYFDLSESGDVKQAAQQLYTILRLAENVPGANTCLIFNLNQLKDTATSSEDIGALFDRIFRACSGNIMQL